MYAIVTLSHSVVPCGHMVIDGKGTCSMGICATDVITGLSFQAMKLLLITRAALMIPTIIIVKNPQSDFLLGKEGILWLT